MKVPGKARLLGALPGTFCVALSMALPSWRLSLGGLFNFRWMILWCCLAGAPFAAGQDHESQKLDRIFQTAVSQYEAGQYVEAAAQLESLLPHAPNSYEIEELLGLAYASQSKDTKALEHLEAAVRLKPKSGEARTNLATTLLHLDKPGLAGEQFQKALELQPKDYGANHNLGEFYIQSGKIVEALPLLEQAQKLNPAKYDNGYDLGLAYFLSGKYGEARQTVERVAGIKNTGELHNLLGQIDEKDGKFVEAANEFEIAAHMDPSEDNLFVWASELLLHRTYEPAIDVFQNASKRYPDSPRLFIGLGMSLFSRGKYDDAVKALLTAADLNPSDSRCYMFLNKAYSSSPIQAEEVIERFRRYAQLEPGNGRAQYYYAMSLWKGKRSEDTNPDLQPVETMLQKAIVLDEKLPEAHVQLGNLYADQHKYDKSIPEYVRALELDQSISDAHYRLGQSYVHVGKKDEAQREFDIYQRLRAQHMAEVDKERAEVQQFVVSAKAAPSTKP